MDRRVKTHFRSPALAPTFSGCYQLKTSYLNDDLVKSVTSHDPIHFRAFLVHCMY